MCLVYLCIRLSSIYLSALKKSIFYFFQIFLKLQQKNYWAPNVFTPLPSYVCFSGDSACFFFLCYCAYFIPLEIFVSSYSCSIVSCRSNFWNSCRAVLTISGLLLHAYKNFEGVSVFLDLPEPSLWKACLINFHFRTNPRDSDQALTSFSLSLLSFLNILVDLIDSPPLQCRFFKHGQFFIFAASCLKGFR